MDKPQGELSFIREAETAHLETEELFVPVCVSLGHMGVLYDVSN